MEIKETKLDESKEYVKKSYDKENTYIVKNGDVTVLKFHCMEQFAWADLAFSTRLGGISEGYLSSMNLGWDRGDDAETVRTNYRLLCNSLGISAENLVLSDQIHETKVRAVGKAECAGVQIEKKLQGIDGLMTDQKEVILATSYADCVPLFFIDSKNKVIASSHSGWRGTVGKIGEETIHQMKDCYGTKPEDTIAIVGPSICQECYEVSEDVIQKFEEAFLPEECLEIYKREPGTKDKYLLDLWAANYFVLKKAGIPPEQIYVSGVCTCCNSDFLFSHRASHGKRGNLNGLLWIK